MMATIDGNTFGLQDFAIDSRVINIRKTSSGSSRHRIDYMGHDGLNITVTGFEQTEAAYKTVTNAFLSRGSHTLVIRSGWQFTVYPVSHNITEPADVPDVPLGYTVHLFTRTPYMESTAQTTRTKSITSDGETWNQDNSSNDISTSGSVDVLPDIKITGNSSAQVINPIIWNTADITTKCQVANTMLSGAIHRINADDTGTIQYSDDFTTNKYTTDASGQYSGITYDDPNNWIEIADDGYIYYEMDCRYPIVSNPVLTATINITAGTPTIQISTDGSTWYDIDTAIVDNVSTEYDLTATDSLVLANKTKFYFRVDCTPTGTHTCDVKTFTLDVNLDTSDALRPVINSGGSANTFKVDVNGGSTSFDVSLIYRDREWAY